MINMKKRWIVCLLVGLSISAGAQQAGMSGPMADYRNGCLKMLEAMEEKDKYDLYEAKEWFGRVKVSTWQDVVAADTGVKEADKVPEVYFDAEFADSLLRHNFDFVPLDEISLMREVDGVGDADLLVMNKAVPAHGTLEFKAMGSGQCQLMLLSAQGAGLTLTVVETATGKEYAGKAEPDGRVACVEWNMGEEEGVFLFRIENRADRKASFVVAVN